MMCKQNRGDPGFGGHGRKRRVAGMFRLWPAWLITIALVAFLFIYASQQVPLTAFKAVNLTLGMLLGFWGHIWGEGHIDDLPISMRNDAKHRRALLMAAGMIAFAMAA